MRALRDADGSALEADAPAGATVREADVRITCGGGTYVRSLARDLARLAGSAAHLTALRRVRSGPFTVEDALTMDALTAGDVRPRPALAALPGFPVQALTEDGGDEDRPRHRCRRDLRRRVGGPHEPGAGARWWRSRSAGAIAGSRAS